MRALISLLVPSVLLFPTWYRSRLSLYKEYLRLFRRFVDFVIIFVRSFSEAKTIRNFHRPNVTRTSTEEYGKINALAFKGYSYCGGS